MRAQPISKLELATQESLLAATIGRGAWAIRTQSASISRQDYASARGRPQGMRDLGYVEGQGIAFERRYAERKNDLLPGLAAELVGLQPNVILAVGTLGGRGISAVGGSRV